MNWDKPLGETHSEGSDRSRRPWLALALAAVIAGSALTGCGGGSDNDGASRGTKNVSIVVWNGETNIPPEVADELADEFHELNPNITVKMSPGSSGSATILQKVTAALAADETPNITYMYGSDVPLIAQSPEVLDLTEAVQEPGWSWNDLYPASRSGMEVDGQVKGVPADMDDVAVFYNKKIFEASGVPEPKPGWTWDEYRAIAKQLTDEGKGVFGTAWPGGGGNDTTWYAWPMIWQAGGDVLTSDGSEVGYGGEPGEKAMEMLHGMSQEDHSVYVDTSPGYTKMLPLFNSGRVGMYLGDSWQLPGVVEAGLEYGVVPVPSWEPGGDAITMAYPDAWMAFDHGDAENEAALSFLKWLGQPAQEARWDVAVASPALSPKSAAEPVYKRYLAETPGLDVFVDLLESNTKAPAAIASYSELMLALGKAQATALLEPDADLPGLLETAVDEGNQVLATSGGAP